MNEQKKDAIVNESIFKTTENSTSSITYDTRIFDRGEDCLFDSDHWQTIGAITGTAKGRGTTWFFRPETGSNTEYVLRHYYRGGLIGRLLKDQYLYTGLENTRAQREFTLLNTLIGLGLPAPRPVAFRVRRTRGHYKADIISERIPGARDLVDILKTTTLSESMWGNIGHTLRRFHDANVYHHDLNTHNILIDHEQKVWLIDFDKGAIRASSPDWKAKNMARLARSFNKEKGRHSPWHWEDTDWQVLMRGYLQDY